MLTLDNITCERGGRVLFNALGVSVFAGSLTILRGANGIGKSSLLSVIAGTLKPTQGAISWNEVPINEEYDTYCTLRSYVSHQQALIPELTVMDNLLLWARLQGSSAMLPAALHYWGLERFVDIPCKYLSAGWQQRVVLARLMASPTRLWLMDEPMTHLDKDGVDRLWNMVGIRCREGGIVIATSHVDVPLAHAVVELAEYAS